jgi:hypothetical protein
MIKHETIKFISMRGSSGEKVKIGTHHLNHVRGMHIMNFKKVRPHARYR